MADQCRPQSFHLLFKFFLRDRAADDHELVPADAAGFTGEHIVQRVSYTADQGVARRIAEQSLQRFKPLRSISHLHFYTLGIGQRERSFQDSAFPVSYTHLRAHET